MATFGRSFNPKRIAKHNLGTATITIVMCTTNDQEIFSLTPVSECGGLFLDSTGQFSSPNYPRAYGDNQLCVYVIQVPAEKRIILTFTQLVTEPDVKCQKDHLEVSIVGVE